MGIRHAIILAAGRGARMAPLTDVLPKPMAPYAGSTLIAHGIEKIRTRVPFIHITVGYKKAMLAQHVIEHGACSVFNTDGHGNAWWLFNTLASVIDEPVYVLTCDNVVELDFELIEEEYVARGNPAGMLVPVRPVEGLDGDYIFHENYSVTEIDRNKPSDIYCSGIQILNPSKINKMIAQSDDFYLVWKQLIERNELKISSVYPKKWFSVDTLAQLSTLNKVSLS